jgi:hypothetical protein
MDIIPSYLFFRTNTSSYIELCFQMSIRMEYVCSFYLLCTALSCMFVRILSDLVRSFQIKSWWISGKLLGEQRELTFQGFTVVHEMKHPAY